MAAVSQERSLSTQLAERGISNAQWHTLAKSLFPGARTESVLLAIDYCQARKLDPLKKPCHIVPMYVKDAQTGKEEWRDVVMPGIYELRTTAQRTGEYLGHSKPEYGDLLDFKGVMAHEWCEMTVYRWNERAQMKAEYPVRIEFAEVVGTRKKDGKPSQRWATAPKQMLTKCTEAAALREAFPDELGGQMSAEEMQDRTLINVTPQKKNTTLDEITGDTETSEAQSADEPEQRSAIPTYDTETAIKALESRRTVKTLEEQMEAILSDFQATERELPIEVEARYDELHEIMDRLPAEATHDVRSL